MYYPIQIPYLLQKEFSENVSYTETVVEALQRFVICFWEMQPRSDKKITVENIILADGCIDLVVDWDKKQIGFAGMSKTDFHFKLEMPGRSFGARLMPGAFCQLTGLPATAAMDCFLPINDIDPTFDTDVFFSTSFIEAGTCFVEYLRHWIGNSSPDSFTRLFDTLSDHLPTTTIELAKQLNFSPRQCQRLFEKYYGLAPKMVLSIVRFQKSLEILTSKKARPADVLTAVQYYDQPHFIRDFKRNIGITPMELIARYK